MARVMTQKQVELYRDQCAAYEKFTPEGRLHVVCPQCLALVLLCDSLPRTERYKIAELAKSNGAAATEQLKTMLPCGEREAKAIVAHLRKGDEGCRHCGAAMPRGALLCATCMAVTLDWS